MRHGLGVVIFITVVLAALMIVVQPWELELRPSPMMAQGTVIVVSAPVSAYCPFGSAGLYGMRSVPPPAAFRAAIAALIPFVTFPAAAWM